MLLFCLQYLARSARSFRESTDHLIGEHVALSPRHCVCFDCKAVRALEIKVRCHLERYVFGVNLFSLIDY